MALAWRWRRGQRGRSPSSGAPALCITRPTPLRRLPALRNKETDEVKLPSAFHLLLGTAQGKGIRWARLGYGMWPPPLVNYVRGFDVLTRKGKLVSTLRRQPKALSYTASLTCTASLSCAASLTCTASLTCAVSLSCTASLPA